MVMLMLVPDVAVGVVSTLVVEVLALLIVAIVKLKKGGKK